MGCNNCDYRRSVGGDTHCAWKPHEHATAMQREIVVWLSELGRTAFTDGGCPGFEPYISGGKRK